LRIDRLKDRRNKRLLVLFVSKKYRKTERVIYKQWWLKTERDLSLHFIPFKITTKNKKDKTLQLKANHNTKK